MTLNEREFLNDCDELVAIQEEIEAYLSAAEEAMINIKKAIEHDSTEGILIGKKFGTKLAGKAGVLGGVILIFIGLEIFIKGIL